MHSQVQIEKSLIVPPSGSALLGVCVMFPSRQHLPLSSPQSNPLPQAARFINLPVPFAVESLIIEFQAQRSCSRISWQHMPLALRSRKTATICTTSAQTLSMESTWLSWTGRFRSWDGPRRVSKKKTPTVLRPLGIYSLGVAKLAQDDHAVSTLHFTADLQGRALAVRTRCPRGPNVFHIFFAADPSVLNPPRQCALEIKF